MRLRTFSAFLVCALFASCGNEGEKTATLEDLYARKVKLPDGTVYTAEVVTTKFDMTRGMMFRDKLPADRGMLFVHGGLGKYPYWTYQVRIPLDIIWLNQNKLITEISANTPFCAESSSQKCPNYGGNKMSLYVLELNAGQAALHKLNLGDRIDF